MYDQVLTVLGATMYDVYFAGKKPSRLCSVRSNGASYFPYGEEKTVTAQGQDEFATYYRDATALDYADQRKRPMKD